MERDFSPEEWTNHFSGIGGFALDAHNRSVGVDLGKNHKVVALRLNTYTDKYRIGSSDLSLWLSNDNKTFLQISGKLQIYLTQKLF